MLYSGYPAMLHLYFCFSLNLLTFIFVLHLSASFIWDRIWVLYQKLCWQSSKNWCFYFFQFNSPGVLKLFVSVCLGIKKKWKSEVKVEGWELMVIILISNTETEEFTLCLREILLCLELIPAQGKPVIQGGESLHFDYWNFSTVLNCLQMAFPLCLE